MASGSLTDKVFLKSAWFEIGNVPVTLLFCFAYLFVLNSRRGWSKGDRAFSGQSLAGNWVTCSPPFFPPAHVYLSAYSNSQSIIHSLFLVPKQLKTNTIVLYLKREMYTHKQKINALSLPKKVRRLIHVRLSLTASIKLFFLGGREVKCRGNHCG